MASNSNTVVIVGGGLAGVRSALEQSRVGKKVYLIEKCPSIASEKIVGNGNLAADAPFSAADLAELRKDSNIVVITNADVKDIAEKDGRFKLTIGKRPSRVIAEKCDNCQACIKVCPVSLFDDYNQGLSVRTAIDFYTPETATYSIFKEDSPICQQTCPVHLDIRGYVGLIAGGKFKEALDLIRQRLPFPAVCGRICPHPCEQQCNRGMLDEPVAIRVLRRFVCDYEMKASTKPRMAKQSAHKDKVAIIGAGPAGLACAHDLAELGFQVTVFESLPVVGGMLYVGIPAYRLPKDILQMETRAIEELGVEIKTNTSIGKDLTIDDLLHQGFKAVFIAVGAHQSRKLGVRGEEATGVIHGVDFLRDLNLGRPVKAGDKVAVIGGGNVAVDAARSAVRLGAKKVFILYRRSRQEMLASKEEIEAAEAEGIEIQYLVAPAEVITSNGKVKALRCTRMKLGEPDASGRRQPIPIEGSEFDIELDMVIPAIGQTTDFSFLGKDSGIETSRGTLVVDPMTLATTRAGVFAGGDAVTGPATAIEAVASGRMVAVAISQYLERK
ncbi:MAG: FAD-dependent oxidoreductase [Chloroflexi bacterium]|nr:FAD-dependent oxidoreductase [Chloroflexota bacterium]